MRTQDTIGLLATAIALLAAAGVTRSFALWSFLGNYTVPWFCGALAIAVLLVTLTAVLTGCPPAAIPVSRVLVVLISASLAVGFGMIVDGISYGILNDSIGSVAEWAGFTVMLAVLFWLPRLKRKFTDKGGPADNVVNGAP